MNKSLLALLLIFVVCFTAKSQTPPFWGGSPTYTVNVSLLNNDPIMTWNFTYYYDWNLKAERYEHYAPQADQMCLMAKPPFTKNDSCTAIFAKDGWSYVMYKQHNWCCKCANKFGAIKYDWLQTNSSYAGQQTVSGYTTQHWIKQGAYQNHYYATLGGLPVKFHEIKHGNPKQWNFDVKSYSTKVDQSLFNPPCSNLCGGSCIFFR